MGSNAFISFNWHLSTCFDDFNGLFRVKCSKKFRANTAANFVEIDISFYFMNSFIK